VGEFTALWTHVICEGTGRPKPAFADPDPSLDGPGLATWYDGVAASMAEEFAATPEATEIWTWHPTDKSARFAARRAAHELAVHRYDAQLAAGAPEPVQPDVAADGIEEIFTMIEAWGPPTGAGDGETIHLHGTDRGDEWLLTLAADGLQVDRRHAKGDLALRGDVSDLELLLYQRPTVGDVERLGDEAVLDAWYRAFNFG
jgi:uncharacterized protein (TIGR03083 family)